VGTIEGPVDRATGEPGAWGPDEAITALYAAHWRGLVRLAWLLVHDQQVAEDVAQEAFVATYRRWASLRSPDAALGYLRTATVNGSRSALRKRGVRERYAAAESGAPELNRHADSAETSVLTSSRREEVLAVLGSLPDRQREVLVLRYYLDLSESDIASALGVSRGAVKSHASRGMATLRARFAAEPGHGSGSGPGRNPDDVSEEGQR
jgi:RNA polymerase sigma-70 factor (sigma-E family)